MNVLPPATVGDTGSIPVLGGWHQPQSSWAREPHLLSLRSAEQLQEIDGETVETVADFTFLGSQITVDGDCSHEIKRLTPWKESYDQPR